MPSVWFVSELYYPERSSTGRVLTNVAEGMASEFEVHALCAQPTYDARGTQAPKEETHKGVRIRRVSSTKFNKNKLVGRAVNALTITASMFFTALKVLKKGDAVITVTNPPTTPFLISLACRLKGARFVLLVHDTYPDALEAAGIIGSGHPLGKLWRASNRRLARASSAIIALGRDAEAKWSGYGGGGKISIVPNHSEPDLILPQPKEGNPLLARLGLEGRFVIQYAGNMGRTHDIDSVAQGIRILAKTDPDIHFLFIGNGAKRKVLEEAAEEAPQALTVMDYQARDGLSDVLNACDWALISLSRGMAGVSVPSRMYNVFCTGKPLLAVADADTELSLVTAEHRLGKVAAPGDPEAFAQAVREIKSASLDPGLESRARAYAAETDLDHMVEGYSRVVRRLFGTAPQ